MDLYQAIISRRSIRRYREEALSDEVLQQVDDIAAHVQALAPENRFRVMRRDVLSGEDLIATMGGYGRIISPPHFLMGYIIGDRAPLVDLGYRMEQIAVYLVQMGISTCFIGSLGRETDIRVRFHLNRETHTGAFLIFGYPAESVVGQALNVVMRTAARGSGKLPASSIFHNGSFDQMCAPPKELSKIIEAGCQAPSANNAQPCRLLWHDDTLYLFVQKENTRYGKAATQNYKYFDAGAHMANIAMAMEAEDMLGEWELLKTSNLGIPEHPETLEALARVRPR
jgi:hypothetical protein